MKNIALALSLALIAVRARAADYRYEGSLESKATSDAGESYDRHFDLVVVFSPKDEARTVATVSETKVCRFSDEPSIDCVSPSAFDPYCETNAQLDLGSVRVSVTERETGDVATKTFPWRAQTGRAELKGGAPACSAANLGGAPVSGEIRADFDLASAKAGTTRALSVSIDPYVAGVGPDELALTTTLVPSGNNAYRTAPWTARAATKALWSYTHEAGPDQSGSTWGTSGFLTLVRK